MNYEKELFDMAKSSAQNAYAPYSKFKVGAAILSSDNHYFSGCNVENISYPVGTCAESGAISAMISGGDSKIAVILIYADGSTLISPCGACRQRILEFSTPDTMVLLADKDGIKQSFNISELIPHSFSEF